MEKLKMHTPDITEKNIDNIAKIFPNVITEARDETGKLKKAVDFDLLRQALSKDLVEADDERYRLDWPGKKASLLKANTPITKTLRPCREESVNFDTTENLYIEGDNFEVLKILQESYLGKVKMIYIDPPYNTGNDFIYKDDFKKSKEEYEDELGVEDEEGARLFKNTDSNGRFHSDWLSMMYERLVVARDLLKEDGILFISIDDNELASLRKACDEIFGEENFEGHIHWRRRHNQPNDKTKMIGLVAEHIIVFSKSKEALRKAGVGKLPLTGSFSNPDNDPRGDWASKPWKVGSDQSGSRYKITTPTGTVYDEDWMGDETTYKKLIADNRIIFTSNGSGFPRKKYFKYEREEEGQCATNWWPHDQFGHNQEGNSEMTTLFDGNKNIFSNPKNIKLLYSLTLLANLKKGDIALDFFSGSSTTAHALMQLNAEDGCRRKFIMVQLPEPCDDNSEAYKAGFKNISDIGKERIRRAGKKIIEDSKLKYQQLKLGEETPDISKLDIGFRVYKVADSNMRDVYYHPTDIKQSQLDLLQSNIKEDRTPEDLLTQVILDLGLELSLPIETKKIHGHNVFIVQTNAMVACFDDSINFKIVDEIAKLQPLKVVFKDAGFKDDKDRINVEERFKRLSPETKVTVI